MNYRRFIEMKELIEHLKEENKRLKKDIQTFEKSKLKIIQWLSQQ